MPEPPVCTSRSDSVKLPANDLHVEGSRWQGLRDEFRDLSSSTDNALTCEGLASHWFGLARGLRDASAQERGCASLDISHQEKQAIALRVAQSFKEMDLRSSGAIHLDEWMHYMLSATSASCVLQAETHINGQLRTLLKKHPRMLGDLQMMFEAADSGKQGIVNLQDIVEMYKRKLWHLSPTRASVILSDEELDVGDPEEFARDIVQAMDLEGTSCVTYSEFMAYCVGRRKSEVAVHLYDISNGAASALAPWLLGHKLEGLWHTGVVVYGREYYFGGDIYYDTPGSTGFGSPTQRIELGFTLWRQEEFHNFIVDELKPIFNRSQYDVITNNCNHFSDRACAYLTGCRLPSEVLRQPESLMKMAAAQTLRPLLNRWLGEIRPLGDSAACQAFAAAPPGSARTLARGNIVAGMVVSILSATGCGPSTPGLVCSLAPPSGGQGASQQGSALVKYLKIAFNPRGSGSLLMHLTTECVPRERLAVARLDELGNDHVYQAAFRALLGSSGSRLSRQGTWPRLGIRGASCGLQPQPSQPPSVVNEDESPPPPSPRSRQSRSQDCQPRRLRSATPTCSFDGFDELDDPRVPMEERPCLAQELLRTTGNAPPRRLLKVGMTVTPRATC